MGAPTETDDHPTMIKTLPAKGERGRLNSTIVSFSKHSNQVDAT